MKPYRGGIRHDYKDEFVSQRAAPGRRWSWFALGLSAPVLSVSLLVSSPNESKVPTPETAPPHHSAHLSPVIMRALPLREMAPPEESAAGDASLAELAASALQLIVNRGDTLELLFRRNGLSVQDLAAMVKLADAGRYLKLLRPGDQIQIAHEDGRVVSLLREIDEMSLLEIARTDDGFEARTIDREVEIRTSGGHGVIRSSLFGAGLAAGLSDAMIMNLAGIFQWDIDFILDVRVGDEFTVLYEELWRDGEKLRNGGILAAEFVNQGRRYRAARYTNAEGRSDYYTPEGRNVRQAFLRAPVDFTRISSNFDLSRRHPILNTIRAHRGVDYAAPTGTPIRAAGDGRVTFRGQRGGYGNTVILQHSNNVTTLYAHMSRFGNQRVGSRVRQGEIIGYVGMSGLATGPHLHYEYQVNGVHRNPRTVPLPAADPIAPQYKADFEAQAAELWRQLDLQQERTRLAAAGDS